jgi:hypothetical protein
VKGVVEGKHTILVIAKRKGFYGARRFDFEVAPANVIGRQLDIYLAELPLLVNDSVLVTIDVQQRGGTPIGVHLMCSAGGERFFPCESGNCPK